ncbi:MAG: hypothetical protein JSS11_14875 [Verrucomicrobia bacterium]|nr:hypothetical protein [Verrucomicrobiota bacterium]
MSDFNVMTYGATGNGSTDDTAAFNAAISALNTAGSGVLVVPSAPNYYNISGSLSSITAKAWVRGDTVAGSRLGIYGGNGIIFDRTAANNGVCRITDVWVEQRNSISSPSTYGISYLGGTPGNTLEQQFWCERCQIFGNWQYGLYLNITGGNRSVIRDVNVYGDSAHFTRTDRAFFIYNPGGNVTLIDCQAQWVNISFYVDGLPTTPTEGTVFRGCEGSAVNYGVIATDYTANTQLYDCFFNQYNIAVQIGSRGQNDIDGLYVLWNSNSAVGIECTGGMTLIRNCRMFGQGWTAIVGIQLEAQYNKVSSCLIGDAGIGLLFGNSCQTCSGRDLTFFGCSTNYIDNGSGNSITDIL